jgi:hypothetical protein
MPAKGGERQKFVSDERLTGTVLAGTRPRREGRDAVLPRGRYTGAVDSGPFADDPLGMFVPLMILVDAAPRRRYAALKGGHHVR